MATLEPDASRNREVEIIDADEYKMPEEEESFAPAVYQSSATLLNSLFFPPYEIVRSDDSDDNNNNDNDDYSVIDNDVDSLSENLRYLEKVNQVNNDNINATTTSTNAL